MELTTRAKTTLTYTELTNRITALSYQPNERALTYLLCDLSRQDDAKGRGMLSAVVVRADTGIPGDGFFELAFELGRTIMDFDNIEERRDLWETELQRVYAAAKVSA